MSSTLTAPVVSAAAPAADAPFVPGRWRWVRKNPTLILGALLLIVVAVIAIAAPWLATHDPQNIDPMLRMKPPSAEYYFGTDALGATCSVAPCGAARCH